MKTKLISGLVAGATLAAFAVPMTAAAADSLGSKPGNTSVEIVDFTIEDGLPSKPGSFALTEVPDIVFGEHTVADLSSSLTVTGDFDGALIVTDGRPTEDSKTKALEKIEKYLADDSNELIEEAEELMDLWTNANLFNSWNLQVKATNMNRAGETDDNIASAIKINGEDVLKEAATFSVTDNRSGTYDYIDVINEEKPSLTMESVPNIGEYTGTITYTALNAVS